VIDSIWPHLPECHIVEQESACENNVLRMSSVCGVTSEGATFCPETMYVFDRCVIAYGCKSQVKHRIAGAMLKTT
jgi:hypothetical protein